MPRQLFIDIETYATVDVTKVGAYRYVEDPEFLILMAAWSVDDGPVTVETDPDAIAAIPYLWESDTSVVRKIAHNAAFERLCFTRFGRDRGLVDLPPHTYLPPEEWHDTMAAGAAHGYPASLENLAKALGGAQKETAGKRLINIFSKPNRKGVRTMPEEKPEQWEEFKEYCRQDVVTMVDAHRVVGELPTRSERRVWLADQHVNDRGIRIDRSMARHAVAAAADNKIDAELELLGVSGGAVVNPASLDQFHGWLASRGTKLPNLRAETVETALETTKDPKVRRALELRQDLALVAAKKYTAALERVCSDGRLRGGFQYYGAHTGRWAGRGVQLQNLPSAQLPAIGALDEDAPDYAAQVDAAVAAPVLDLEMGLGADANTLKALVRAMFLGPLDVVDYSAIEARVIAWLAGEEWALKAFRAGRDIYVETAERMGGLTRKQGKIAVLALGYNGGINSLRAMGGEGTDQELWFMVDTWRRANPNIVRLWDELQQAFGEGGRVGTRTTVEVNGDDRLLRLPSGRALTYHNVKWERYRAVDPKTHKSKIKEGWRFDDPKMPGRRNDTYGGRLAENITQAVARDLLAEAVVRLDRAGHPVVGHVHDEILVESAGPGSLEAVTAIMVKSPAWAVGLPIDAEGFTCQRYRKD